MMLEPLRGAAAQVLGKPSLKPAFRLAKASGDGGEVEIVSHAQRIGGGVVPGECHSWSAYLRSRVGMAAIKG
jgi:hypothetical protein